MSRLYEQRNDLARFHHPKLLRAIHTAVLAANPLFWNDKGHLVINADAIARSVSTAQKWAAQDILDDPGARISTASTYTGVVDDRQVQQPIEGTAAALRQRFQLMAERAGCTPAELLGKHTTTIAQSPLLGQADPDHHQARQILTTTDRVRRRSMTLRPQPKFDPVMRWNKAVLTLQVPNDIVSRLADALQREAFARWKGDQEDIVDVLAEQRSQPNSSLHKFTRVLDTETVGLLHREIRLRYLTYQAEQTDVATAQRLRDLARRIRLFQAYLRNTDPLHLLPEKAFQVTFLNETCDLRVLFGQARAFDKLPIFPLIDGHIGESSDFATEQRTYTLGLRWKLNGDVQTDNGQSSYAYHLDFLRGQTRAQVANPPKLVRPGDLVHCAVLYYIVFAHFGEPGFDPLTTLETEVLAPLRGGATLTRADGHQLLQEIIPHYRVTGEQLAAIAQGIKTALRRKTLMPTQNYDVSLNVLTSVMEPDRTTFIEKGEPLKSKVTADRKDYLAYLEVSDSDQSARSLLNLDVTLRIEDMAAYPLPTATEETYDIDYVADAIRNLPVYLYLHHRPLACTADANVQPPRIYDPLVFVPIVVAPEKRAQMQQLASESERVAWFIYRYVVVTILYITLDVLGSFAEAPQHVYMTLARHHERPAKNGDPNDADGFLAMLGKTVAFMLSHDYLANSQGFQQEDPYRLKNALESLLSILPKRFAFTTAPSHTPAIPRVALVVVSSRESDSTTKTPRDARLITVYGDITEMVYDGDHSIIVRPVHRFSGTDTAARVFSHESLIIDEIHHLYRVGFRHIIYIAQSPHTNTLKMAQLAEEHEEAGLFYLSPTLISEFLRNTASDPLHIYPLFRDQYPAMRLPGFKEDAWLMSDPHDLADIVPDRSRSMVVFLNILSGKLVSPDSAFHGVASYATLLNIYDQILDEQDLRGLLYEPMLRDTIARYLLLFHLARYESAFKVNVKLDPFERIIGSNAIGAEATRNHVVPYVQCNFLSYLSLVRQALHPSTPEVNA